MKLTDDLRTARAAYERQLCAELRQHAAHSTQPPSDSQVLDLWAHLRNMRDDGTGAWVMVHKILDLGWRPMGTVPTAFPVIEARLRDDEVPAVDPDDYDGDLFGEGAA